MEDFTNVSLYATHIPDPGPDEEHQRPETVELGPGFIEVGVEIQGQRKALTRFKAGKFLQQLEQRSGSSPTATPNGQ